MTSRTQGSASASEPSTANLADPAQLEPTDTTAQQASASTEGDAMDVEPQAISNVDAVQEEPPAEEGSAAADPTEGEEALGKDMSPSREPPVNGRKTSSNSSRKSSQVPKGQSRSRSKSAKASSSRDDNGEEGVVAADVMTESPHAQSQDISAGAQEQAPVAVPMSRRQRSSSSSVKALAGLGLAHLGDGDDGSLAPRRTRRAAATSPSAPGNTLKKEEEGVAEDEDPADRQGADDAKAEGAEDYDEEAEGDADGDIEGVTRCVCGSEDENVGLMIQCETCKCWQHCVCMGMHTEEDCPDVYYCEQCKPELHIPLLRALGLLPPAAKGHKKSSKNSKQASRESMKELMQARDAVALLAQQNAQRRREGQEVVVAHPTANSGKRAGEGRRNTSESAHDQESRSNRGNSDVPASPRGGAPGADRRSPKRRSTMNSRDSGYGWEPIPPGLLNEDEVWDDVRPKKEDEEGSSSGRKRKRTGGSRRDEEQSPSPAVSPPMGPAELAKRRRMSGSAAASSNAPNNGSNTSRGEGRRRSPSDAVEASVASASSQGTAAYVAGSGKKVGGGSGGAAAKAGDKKLRDDSNAASAAPAVKAKQPNQYTYRKERLANGGSAGGLANGGNGIASAGRTVSPTPSPSKSGRRGAAALREGSTMGSRTSTPAPGDVRVSGHSRNSNLPGGAWGLPEHLSHLVNLLPTSQPEPLTLHLPSTKGLSNPRSGAAKDHHAENSSSSRPSPHPFTIVDVSEPPTKVRWPPKRMTMGEMRKRVRNISEYVTNKQLEAVERGKRMKDLGIEIVGPASDSQAQLGAEVETGGGAGFSDAMEGVEGADGALERPSDSDSKAPAIADKERIPLSMKLMDELTRELIAFQQKYGVPPGSMAVLGAGFSSFASGAGGAVMTAASTTGPEANTEVAGGQGSDGAAAASASASAATLSGKANGATAPTGEQQQDAPALALSPDMAAAVVATAGEEGVTA